MMQKSGVDERVLGAISSNVPRARTPWHSPSAPLLLGLTLLSCQVRFSLRALCILGNTLRSPKHIGYRRARPSILEPTWLRMMMMMVMMMMVVMMAMMNDER